ncbi:MAG: V-type ATPase subunit [bacterium]|nr:V-type ATPase subunit [bacterium]
MSYVEAPFIIAVIRSKEKNLLGDNEITRMMHASSLKEAREVLMSTPYAPFITGDISVQDGLTSYAEAEFGWLSRSIENRKILAFIGARYDMLHIASGIIALAKGELHMPAISTVGLLSQNTLQEMIFTESFEETTATAFYVNKIAVQKEAIANNTWSMPFLFAEMRDALEELLESLATTPFMHALVLHVKNHHASDIALRSNGLPADATAYEWEWDATAIELARTKRFEPTGHDPIIAYWIIKEMEIKTINLLCTAIAGGFTKQEATALIRPFAHV